MIPPLMISNMPFCNNCIDELNHYIVCAERNPVVRRGVENAVIQPVGERR
jgi:hypothetical protein